MSNLRLYTGIYVALLALATSKVVFYDLFDYWTAVIAIFIAAILKTALIMGYFQHLKYEPRSLSYLMLSSIFVVGLLTIAASYSIA